jgi:hypothetical protein
MKYGYARVSKASQEFSYHPPFMPALIFSTFVTNNPDFSKFHGSFLHKHIKLIVLDAGTFHYFKILL